MEAYTNSIREILDNIDQSSSRGSRFVRATEIKPFTQEDKSRIVKNCKTLLDEITELRNVPSAIYERIDVVYRLFMSLMEYPEFLARFPKFRVVSENKANELMYEISSINLTRLEILYDYTFFLNMIKLRSDYVEYNPVIHGTVSESEKEEKETHSYFLRSKNQK
jgi:hypothetical protein